MQKLFLLGLLFIMPCLVAESDHTNKKEHLTSQEELKEKSENKQDLTPDKKEIYTFTKMNFWSMSILGFIYSMGHIIMYRSLFWEYKIHYTRWLTLSIVLVGIVGIFTAVGFVLDYWQLHNVPFSFWQAVLVECFLFLVADLVLALHILLLRGFYGGWGKEAKEFPSYLFFGLIGALFHLVATLISIYLFFREKRPTTTPVSPHSKKINNKVAEQ